MHSSSTVTFPLIRPRRLRRTPALRSLVAETRLQRQELIYPLFVDARLQQPESIKAMPGQYRWPVKAIAEEAARAYALGLRAVLLFGLPEWKDAQGSSSWQPDGVVQRAVAAIKRTVPELLVITDVCLCEYTDHGHCGVLNGTEVDNDGTLELLARQAVSHARAGADIVAPSDMMDGRVQAIRTALDAAGMQHVPILSYAAKYASGFYGPFREAAESAPAFGDRRSYQMDARNAHEALREVEEDIAEGADLVMVKPALAYLDVIHRVKERVTVPVVAYNVSGEYSMVKAAAAAGMVDEFAIVYEVLTAIKRAGADLIITYHAPDVACWMSEGRWPE
jgi:porphobilinogen synthase